MNIQPTPCCLNPKDANFRLLTILSLIIGAFAGFLILFYPSTASGAETSASPHDDPSRVHYRTEQIDGLDVFYREAGPKDAPTVLLLHGFPTSSHMFRNLIPELATEYHVIAPDYPGYGQSSAPPADEFDYSFDNLASIMKKLIDQLGLENYSLYLFDYGAPIGFRIATAQPERIESLLIQNGNAYEEGLREFWEPLKTYWNDPSPENREQLRGFLSLEGTRWQYVEGVRNVESISPDNWTIDQRLLDREGNQEIQLDLFLSYGTNPPLYPAWQEYLRKYQPPTLITWGANDPIFPAEGAHPYKRDLETIDFHLFDTGHFALEEDGNEIATLILKFLGDHVRVR